MTTEKELSLREALPAIWTLVSPHKWTLMASFLLLAIGRAARLFLPFSSKYMIDTVVLKHQPEKLPWLVSAVLITTVLAAVTSFLVAQLLTKTTQKLVISLRKQVQTHIAHLPVSYYDSTLAGALVSRIMSDVEGLGTLTGIGMVDFSGSLITSVITFFVLMSQSWKITLVVAVVMILYALASKKGLAFSRPILRENSKIRAEISGRLTESIGGVRVIKGYRAEDREAEVFARGAQKLLKNVMRSRTGFSTVAFTSAMVVGVNSALVMLLAGRLIFAHQWTTGDYVQYMAMLTYLLNPISVMVSVGMNFTQAIAGLDRVREVLEEHVEDADPIRTTNLPLLSGEVLVEDVSFAYEADRPVLHQITFEAQPGTLTAFVGPSGSGKSTIISLLCAFHKPGSGRILIDGIDLSTATLSSYRSQLGLVLQETFLFDGTIRENILFSRPDATEKMLLDACRIACVDEFAKQFPKSYDTVVGERGVKLSGGQRQRLSIARAILADPRILILDEATSSLDSESEAMIQEGLSYLMQGRTTFVIAHRLSTVRRANQILVLETGRILERGTHESLYELGGRYYELYTRQYGLEKDLFLVTSEKSGA
jgi:ABC-type multidrug transport system fused ATPase/permease subunit